MHIIIFKHSTLFIAIVLTIVSYAFISTNLYRLSPTISSIQKYLFSTLEYILPLIEALTYYLLGLRSHYPRGREYINAEKGRIACYLFRRPGQGGSAYAPKKY
jgi:hypothetical protein